MHLLALLKATRCESQHNILGPACEPHAKTVVQRKHLPLLSTLVLFEQVARLCQAGCMLCSQTSGESCTATAFLNTCETSTCRESLLGQSRAAHEICRLGLHLHTHTYEAAAALPTSLPRFGRDLTYAPFLAELLIAGSSPEVYRMSLEEGRFMTPLTCRSPSVNACGEPLVKEKDVSSSHVWHIYFESRLDDHPKFLAEDVKLVADEDRSLEWVSLIKDK